MVAISLTVKTLAAGLSDKLQPGDIIRIYHFLDKAEEIPELCYVRVLSVTDAKGVNVDNTREPSEDEEKQQSATITVLANPEQARRITELENELHNTYGAADRSAIAIRMEQQLLDDCALFYASHLRMTFVMKPNIEGFSAHPSDYYEIRPELDKT